mmetsp:Transcript_23489/g.72541  ORF Transcript_23489/g.72541 Transcript_23489/m.72541 type:complete len:201 (-) Transcript_23489:158-760(-)
MCDRKSQKQRQPASLGARVQHCLERGQARSGPTPEDNFESRQCTSDHFTGNERDIKHHFGFSKKAKNKGQQECQSEDHWKHRFPQRFGLGHGARETNQRRSPPRHRGARFLVELRRGFRLLRLRLRPRPALCNLLGLLLYKFDGAIVEGLVIRIGNRRGRPHPRHQILTLTSQRTLQRLGSQELQALGEYSSAEVSVFED